MALSVSSGKWRLLDEANAIVVEFLNNSGGDLTEGTLLTHSSGVVAAAGDANTVGALGVIVRGDVANGKQGSLCIFGMFEVGSSASLDFAIAEAVYSLAAGLVDKGTTGDIPVGFIAPYTNPASGVIVHKVMLASVLMPGQSLSVHA